MADVSVGRNIPRYQLLAEQLIEGILSGEFAVGECLPTEAVLCAQYNVSRFTVREAMKILQSKGLIATRRGKGSEVIADSVSEEAYSFSSDSYTDVVMNAEKTYLADITLDEVESDTLLAEAMQCNPGQKMLRLRAIRRVKSQKDPFIVCYMEAYILGCYGAVRNDIGKPIAISKMIETRFGVSTMEIRQRVVPVAVHGNIANALDVEDGTPALKMSRAYRDKDGEIFNFVTNYYAGDKAELTMSIKRT